MKSVDTFHEEQNAKICSQKITVYLSRRAQRQNYTLIKKVPEGRNSMPDVGWTPMLLLILMGRNMKLLSRWSGHQEFRFMANFYCRATRTNILPPELMFWQWNALCCCTEETVDEHGVMCLYTTTREAAEAHPVMVDQSVLQWRCKPCCCALPPYQLD